MPVIKAILPDPTDLVLQGEQLRSSLLPVLEASVGNAYVENYPRPEAPLFYDGLQGEQRIEATLASWSPTVRVLRDQDAPRANAGVATPTGAWVPLRLGQAPVTEWYGSTVRWQIAGTTRDASGTPQPGCDVIAVEVGRMVTGGSPVVARGTSDGSGAFALHVGSNAAHQLIAYLPGSPDVGGVSVVGVTVTED